MSGNASVAVARVSKSFGSEGELLVSLFDTFPDDFDLREPLFVEIDRLAVPLFCDRFERRGRNGALVVFADFYSERRTAELIGRELFLCGGRLADGEEPPGDGLVYLEDLVGLEASVGDAYGGVIEEFIDGENPLFLLRIDGREIYVPAVDEFIVETDLGKRSDPFRPARRTDRSERLTAWDCSMFPGSAICRSRDVRRLSVALRSKFLDTPLTFQGLCF